MAHVLITGANRGIGLALARAALASGDRVTGTARVPSEADALRDAGASVVALDVADPDASAQVAAGLDTAVDLLVCNAGQFVARGGIDDPEYTAANWQAMLMTNVAGPFFTVRAVLPRLAEGAKVAIISSTMASTSRAPGSAYIYRASKAAATNIAANLAAELRGRGIAVGAYHPGWVQTDMGGPSATLGAEESASKLLARFDALSLETTGCFEDPDGHPLPL